MTKGPFDGTSVFILEDEPLLRKRLVAHLEKQGADTMAVGTLAQARTCLAEATFDVALIDIGLPDGSGLDLLNESLFGPSTPIIVMTAMGGVQTAVNAMKLGACDFITKPVEPDVLSLAMLRARQGRQTRRIDEFRSGGRGDLFFCEATRGVREMLDRIMQAESRLGGGLPPVLIEGETGTGKTSIARWLHNNGARKDKPFIDVNCSALPESLAESELFGHEKGAFTDARQMRIGLFEAADGGTLFLDEIPSLSLPIQAKVLKAVEEGRIRRVGSRKDVAVDVRLITATNRDLGQMAARGEFRVDLMHRLDLLRIKIPPCANGGKESRNLRSTCCRPSNANTGSRA
jgi:DNA-binding NtrC family response regulator